ncbi:hypothetical protein BDD12DRAFT_770053 [Trichophaea hybrida]|nr:hypothetical protein BDD12DRAFT_770053 [Trichophaea hybrida]
MGPLSGAVSIIAVIQISTEVLTLCAKYAKDTNDDTDDIDCVSNEISALYDVLNKVNDLTNRPDEAKFSALRDLTMSISQCSSDLTNLETRPDPGQRQPVMKRLGLCTLKWPFKSKNINKCITSLERSNTTIISALSADQR